MESLLSVVQWILNLGVSVMLPIIIIVIGLALGAGVKKSVLSGMKIGVGFVGINLVIALMTGDLGPAAQAMTSNLGLNLEIIDIGWPAMSAISWAWVAAGLSIPLVLVINIIMIALKLTKTMDIDIWNYWQFAFVGSAVTALTDSVPLGLIACSIAAIVAFVLADITQPYVEKYFNLPGISFPHLTALGFLPIVMPLNWLLDKVPGINKLHADPESISKRLGLFGEPIMMGFVIGILLGIFASYPIESILSLGVNMAAVMFIMPKMVAILMEGLIPISEAAKNFMAKNFKGREIFIGLDAAVALGEPSVIAVGLLLVPVTIVLAFVLPYNRVLPFADLAVIPFLLCLVVAMCKGNVIRSLIVGTVIMAFVLFFATSLAPAETTMAIAANVTFPAGATMIGNLDRANFLSWFIIQVFNLFH
jgi:PTS system galactitol-specific IIC component